jgi:exosortase
MAVSTVANRQPIASSTLIAERRAVGTARNLLGSGYGMPAMKTIQAPARNAAQEASRTTGTPLIASALFLGLIWYNVIAHLKVGWSNNPQYHYAWSVPFLVAYIFWRRWLDRPAPEPTTRVIPFIAFIVGGFLLIPLRFVAEANPDWRLLSWGMSCAAVAISLAFLLQVGGRPWLRHFAFPFLFFLVAVPWPVQLEQAIIQNLMRSVTAINVFFLSVAGIPALQHGNVIEVSSGLIGIEEACSGVRSLQATFMVSLFLGELYSFSARRRIILVVAGAVLAVTCNIVRTSILVWVGANRGTHAIESWHDPAGLTILLICLFGLWALSLVMSHRDDMLVQNRAAIAVLWADRVPTTLLLSMGLCLILGEIGTQAWYRSHQSEIANSHWTADWPRSQEGYETVKIPTTTQEMLHYDQGGGARWSTPDSHHWMMYFFRWLPGRTAALFVKIHRPDVCLPASGLTLNRDDGIRPLSVNGIKLPVRSYRFDDHGVPLHVMYCYWDARSSYDTVNAAIEEDWTPRGRIRTALKGRREQGAQLLELVVWGYQDDDEARESLERQLASIVRAES